MYIWIQAQLERWVVGWFAPLLLSALLIPAFQIFVLANNWIAGIVCLVIGGLLVWHSWHEAHTATPPLPWWQSWQLWVFGILFGVSALLAFASPAYYHLWALLLELVVLLALFGVPGIVLVQAKRMFIGLLSLELFLTLVLMAGRWGNASAPVGILALLAAGLATILFAQSARPYEIRRAQRRAASWLYAIAVVATVLAFGTLLWPVLRGATFVAIGHDPAAEQWVARYVSGQNSPVVASVTVAGVGGSVQYKSLMSRTDNAIRLASHSVRKVIVPDVVKHWYNGRVAEAEANAESSFRRRIGEASKTIALEQSQYVLKDGHIARWAEEIAKMPKAPISPQEQKELGIPDP